VQDPGDGFRVPDFPAGPSPDPGYEVFRAGSTGPRVATKRSSFLHAPRSSSDSTQLECWYGLAGHVDALSSQVQRRRA
jgi:hypothetical protein